MALTEGWGDTPTAPVAATPATPAPSGLTEGWGDAAPAAAPEPETPSILGTLGRSAVGGAVLSFDDEIVGALKSAFTDKTYKQARDDYRATRKLDADTNPIANTVGEIGGSLAPALVTGGASEAATAAEAAPTIGKLAIRGAKMGAAYGAAQGLGDSTADLTQGDFGQAIKDTLTGGAIGGVGGAILEPVAGKLFGGAGARERKDIVRGIVSGDGTKGKATATASKLIAKREASIVNTVLADPELREAVGKPSVEALPVVKDKMAEVGAQLKPLDDQIDASIARERAGHAATLTNAPGLANVEKLFGDLPEDQLRELAAKTDDPLTQQWVASKLAAGSPQGSPGGISLGSIVRNALKDVDVDHIRGEAGSETKVKAIKEWLGSMLNALGPHDPEGNSTRIGDTLFHDSGRVNPNVVDALDNVRIPTNAFRSEVTRLQDRGIAVLDSLSNRATSTNIKQEIAQEAKNALDAHMDVAAHLDPSLEPVVAKRRALNSTYSDLATMARAIDERGWKEKSQGISAGGLIGKLAHAGAGIAAVSHVVTGGVTAIPHALAIYMAPKAMEMAAKLGPKANRALAQLAENATNGSVTAKMASSALNEGVPMALVLEVIRKSQPQSSQ